MIDRPSLAAIRFGFGLPLPKGAPVEPAMMLAALSGPDVAAFDFPASGLVDVLPVLQAAQAGRMAMRAAPEDRAAYAAAAREAGKIADIATRSQFSRALDAPDGFRERLVRFWADHFTTKPRNRPETTLPGALIEDAIRPHVAGRFGDMLEAAVLHPAMLAYLDQVASVGPGSRFGKRRGRGLNENLAREVLELHTLGVGAGYGQTDVREMAELLTGLDATAAEGLLFRPERAEPGPETVLGKTYSGAGMAPIRAALQDLAQRPETALHLARKLAVHFVADDPDPDLVGAIAAAYRQSGGGLLAAYEALLTHPAAWVQTLAKARQPLDFTLAALRALGWRGRDVMALGARPLRRFILRPMALMGQEWGRPNGPDGWPESVESWITPQGLGARIAWAMEVPDRLVKTLPDPQDFAQTALGPAADARLLWAVARAETRREGVGLVLASPAFNRR
jgi:uncharacterized protein (DUF1800 family)